MRPSSPSVFLTDEHTQDRSLAISLQSRLRRRHSHRNDLNRSALLRARYVSLPSPFSTNTRTGNVQLSTTLTSSVPLPASPSAPSIIALLKLSESAAQTKVAEAYASLAEEGFRGLRRALPKTRSKLDWAKIASYRLGNELGGAVGPEV